jgi:predicted aldo/keto reductase-like oxidoreductase
MLSTKVAVTTGTRQTFMETLKIYLENGSIFRSFFYKPLKLVVYMTPRFKRTGKRDSIFLATKFGITPQGTRGDPEYVKETFSKSLERLGVDYVDLYYIHR